MKILLIQPAKARVTLGGEDYFLYEPLALEYLAAPLVGDHDVRILDMRLEKDLASLLDRFSPQIVGITAYTVHVKTVRRLFEEIKTRRPEVLTVVGGHHATVAPEDFHTPWIDLVVRGEGVFAFREIVQRYEKGESFAAIGGVSHQQDGEWTETEPQPPHDLDAIPFPDRRLTASYRKEYYSEWMRPLASIRTSKGCPFRCNFCALWKLTNGRYLKRSPERVLQELAGIEEECVFFADDESLVDAARMSRLAEMVTSSGLKKRFFLYGRSDTISKNPDLLAKWKKAGLERVFVGLEFFRDTDLEFIRKHSTIQDNATAIRILQDLDLEIYASFIIRPDFGREDFAQFRAYCRGLRLNFASFAVLTPLPGTDFHAQVKDEMITQNYDLFDFIHTLLPTKLSLREFYEEYYRLALGYTSFRTGMSLMRKFPLRDWPRVTAKSLHWYSRLRAAHRDYESSPA